MEPLDIEWIKDYDPLFELFDEEMQTAALTAATSNLNHNYHHTNNAAPCEAYLTPISDYYYTAASFAATNTHQQQQQHQQQHLQTYHATIPAPTVAPTTTITSQQGYASADGYDLSQYIFSNQQYQQHNQPLASTQEVAQLYTSSETSTTTATSQTVATTTCSEVSYVTPQQQQLQTSNNNNISSNQHQHTQATDELSLFLGLDWLPSLDNELTETASPATTVPSSVSAPVTPSVTHVQSESTSSSSSSAYSSLAPSPCDTPCTKSKKRKSIRSRGTSLLAQPSLNKKETSDLISFNIPILQLSRSAAPQQQQLQQQQQQSTSAYVPLTAATTTTTATLLTYSNIANIARQVVSAPSTAALSKLTATVITNDASTRVKKETRQLSKLELTSRLCVRIEHDYAMVAT